jgi:uncharacterized protein YcfJ
MAVNGLRCPAGLLILIFAATGMGCANHTQRGTALGAVGGSALGAIVGHQLGDAGMGALVGGLAGATAGGLAGNAQDEADRADAYAQHAAYQHRQRVYDSRAMTNRDVINMAYSGASDGLIISTMQSRGGRFDTSPDAVIHLHKQGVSDRVIQAMQQVESNRSRY